MNRKRLGGGDGDGVVYGFDFYGFFNVGERKGKERKGKERKGKEKKRYIRFCVTCKSVCCFW